MSSTVFAAFGSVTIVAMCALGCSAAAQDLGNSDPNLGDGGTADTGNPNDTAMRVFATSSAYTGNLVRFAKPKGLTGTEAADWLCADAAKNAALGGNWRAWISESDADASDRIKADGPWVSVDRKAVTFKTVADVGAQANDRYDAQVLLENGKRAEGAQSGFVDKWGNPTAAILDNTIYTGSTAGGRTTGVTCNDWTSESAKGTYQYLNSQVGSSEIPCDAPRSLLCLEQRLAVTVPKRGRMFITQGGSSGQLTAAGVSGVEAADALCGAEAADAGLKGQFVAWISGQKRDGTQQVASQRVATSTFDGWSDAATTHVIFASAASTAKTPRAAFNFDAAGKSIQTFNEPTIRVWTGTTATGAASSSNCSNWSSEARSANGAADSLPYGKETSGWGRSADNYCLGYGHIYCFEL